MYSQLLSEACPIECSPGIPLTPVPSSGLGQLAGTQNLGLLTVLDWYRAHHFGTALNIHSRNKYFCTSTTVQALF